MNKYSLLISFIILLFNMNGFAITNKPTYSLDEQNAHHIHVLKLNPEEYQMELVSGHDSVFGREFLADIVKRKNADIGINAGFFEIAGNDDGMPCGALFIDGKFYGMQSKNLPCIIKKGSKVEIKNLQPSLAIFIGNNEFKINRFNKYINNKQTYLYNDSWGKSTLSNYNTRTEIIISSDNKLLEISSHGDSKIPDGGYVISLPGNYKLPKMQVGDKVTFK
ncbi:MAG: hypothetical protein HRU35_02680, partial [Rickettsiaceae bacterium]|nr:hypothetical protein [Rickettsiaceae bacterium]